MVSMIKLVRSMNRRKTDRLVRPKNCQNSNVSPFKLYIMNLSNCRWGLSI